MCIIPIWLQISRNAKTGESRGCGYVTMSSVNAAKVAIGALDGSVSVKLLVTPLCLISY
jgi:RNA recognition motif-containing protein